MVLHPAQNKIAESKTRFRVLDCGRKFGKTTLAVEEIAGYASFNDKIVKYIAPTLSDARGLLWDKLTKKFENIILDKNEVRLELKIRTPDKGIAQVSLGSWELFNDYRGFEYDFLVFDEVQEYRNFWVGWHEAMRATLSPRMGSALFMGTPSKGLNHFYDLHNFQFTNKDYQSFTFTTYDNPYISREEIENARLEMPEDKFAREYLAEFRKSEGLVIKEFERNLHIFDFEVTGFSEKLCGVDFGFTNPAAILTVLFKDGAYYVYNELYKTGLTDSQVADYVSAQRYNAVYPDPESASGIEEMKRRRINVREVIKGKDSIRNGLDKIRELLLSNRLFIHKSCVNLISELETYSYPDKMIHHNESEKPIDEYNHAIDALRYVVMMHSPRKPLPQRRFYDKTVEIWRM